MKRSKRNRSAAKLAESSVAAPQVVAPRTAHMALWESMNAMALEMAKAQQQYALLAVRQWWSPWVNPSSAEASAAKVLDKELAPVHKRASANARRLRKRRRP